MEYNNYNTAICAKLAELEAENRKLKEENRLLRKEMEAFKAKVMEEIGQLKEMIEKQL